MTKSWIRCPPPARSIQHFAGTNQRITRRDVPVLASEDLEDIVAARLSDEVKAAVHGKAFKLNQTDHAQGHILPDVRAWLRLRSMGCGSTFAGHGQIQKPLSAASTSIDAASEFILRYTRLAHEQFEAETELGRQNELASIASTCEWLAKNPPRDFREALQSVWFLFVLLQIESNASSFSLGRFDQYLLPYLERDLEIRRFDAAKSARAIGISVAQVQ